MVTDDRFGRATPQMQALTTRARECLRPLVEAGRVPVTQGFIGATAEGTPTTLGRGGSDFTAALLGAALGAERVEIWTDVNGLMTADPRIVPSARTLRAASYEEAAELATFGAKVLHPATALPLVRAGIPIVVLNSTRPDDPGTIIEPSAELERLGDSPMRSICWKRGITVVNVRAPAHARRLRLPPRHVRGVRAPRGGGGRARERRGERLAHGRGPDPARRGGAGPGRAGRGVGRERPGHRRGGRDRLRSTPGLAARLFRAVQPANVEVISQGASAINMTFVVREEDGPDVVRRLHQEFFGTC